MSLRISFWSVLLCFGHAVGTLGQAFSVTDYIVAGTGCPPGTTTAAISATGKAFSLIYSSFIAQSGPGTKYSDSRKNCQATLNIQVPAGYQFSLNNANYVRAMNYIPFGDGSTVWMLNLHFSTALIPSARESQRPMRQHATVKDPIDVTHHITQQSKPVLKEAPAPAQSMGLQTVSIFATIAIASIILILSLVFIGYRLQKTLQHIGSGGLEHLRKDLLGQHQHCYSSAQQRQQAGILDPRLV
ncbi:hypothetical protein CVT25_008855 [Psilocybe cyanescens]|uniref:Uncharacterized protein n=1 Tax=Psilocybe cyanescens TaxID=93625 RepID=A0A409XAQ8_PSICY|nr:hypothetical protein CVT25_008855 [Psilocybe cyanescens]